MTGLDGWIISARVIGKIPEEWIPECLSEAHDWHTTLGCARVRIRCPFFFWAPYASARARVCLSVCLSVYAGVLEGPWWIQSGNSVSSGKQRSRQTPKTHGCFVSSCALLLITRARLVHNGRIGRFESTPMCVYVCVREGTVYEKETRREHCESDRGDCV